MSKWSDIKFGTVNVTQKTKIDLTKDMPEIVDITFLQTYSPDKSATTRI